MTEAQVCVGPGVNGVAVTGREGADHALPEATQWATATGRGFAAVVLAGVLLALVLSAHFFVQPLRPWPDQGWVLEAALRHARGQGLTTSMSGVGDDVTRPTYHWLVYFPPLYPLAISLLLQAGMSIDAAVKSVNAVCLLAGVAGWAGLGYRYLSRPAYRLLFVLLLVVAAGAAIPRGGTADYILWAGVAYWFLFLLAAREAMEWRSGLVLVTAAAAAAALLISVRWAAVFLVPAGCLFLLKAAASHRTWRQRVVGAGVYGALPTLTYGAIILMNRRWSGTGSMLAFVTPHWDFTHLATLYPLESLTTIPLGLEPLLKRGWRAVDPAMTSEAWGLLFRLALPALILAGLLWGGRRLGSGGSRPGRPHDLRALAAITGAVLVLFLGYMTVRYNWGEINWSYLDEPRYFRPLLPAACLFWLTLVEAAHGQPRVRNAALLLLAGCFLYLLQAQARAEYRRLKDPDESLELTRQVRALNGYDGLQVVYDTDISDYLIAASPNLVARSYPDPARVSRLASSRPADLWLVFRVNEKNPYSLDPDFDLKHFAAMATAFHVQGEWTSSRGNYELYHARIGPAPAASVPGTDPARP